MTGGDHNTDFGFAWGPMDVERLATFPRPGGGKAYVLGVATGGPDTPFHRVDIYVSRTGRSVRIFKDGRELK